EGVIHPEQLTDEWRQRGEMPSHPNHLRHEQASTHQPHTCRTPAICSRTVRLIFIRALQMAPMTASIGRMTCRTNGGGKSQNPGPAGRTTGKKPTGPPTP